MPSPFWAMMAMRYRAWGSPDAAPAQRILTHLCEPAEPPPTPGMEEVEPRLEQRPRISPARGPPAWEDPPVEDVPDWDALAQPPPEYVFDPDVQW
jgi:hypothetical protein